MTRKNTIMIVAVVLGLAVLGVSQGENLIRLEMRSLIGLHITAPSTPPSGYSEAYFDSEGCFAYKKPSGAIATFCNTPSATGGGGGSGVDTTLRSNIIGAWDDNTADAVELSLAGGNSGSAPRAYAPIPLWLTGLHLCFSGAQAAGDVVRGKFRKSNPGDVTYTQGDFSVPTIANEGSSACIGPSLLDYYPVVERENVAMTVNSSTSYTEMNGYTAAIVGTLDNVYGAVFATTVATNSVAYVAPGSVAGTTETAIPIAWVLEMDWTRICANTSTTQPGTGTLVVSLRTGTATSPSDMANTALSVTLAASSLAGSYCADVNVTTPAGSLIDIELDNNATGAASANIQSVFLVGRPADTDYIGVLVFPHSGSSAFTASSTTYVAALGGDVDNHEAENFKVLATPYLEGMTLDDMSCYITVSPTNSVVFTVRHDGVDSPITTTVGAGGVAHQFYTSTGSETYNQGDQFALQVQHTGGGTATQSSGCTVGIKP